MFSSWEWERPFSCKERRTKTFLCPPSLALALFLSSFLFSQFFLQHTHFFFLLFLEFLLMGSVSASNFQGKATTFKASAFDPSTKTWVDSSSLKDLHPSPLSKLNKKLK